VRRQELWRHIHAERAALAEALSGIAAADWDRPSLCAGWTVKDVAAHVISTPQLGWRELAAMAARNLGRGPNAMIFREVKRLGRTQTPASVLADFERYAGSTRHVPVTTTVEPLVDVLVHTQDVLRPLGLRHDMPPEAAAAAADRVRLVGAVMGWRPPRVRLVATDTSWTRGTGPSVEGPMQELLMLSAGRSPDAARLDGDGRERLALS
jgi:uncharacterized protein (TIGR03083 family)